MRTAVNLSRVLLMPLALAGVVLTATGCGGNAPSNNAPPRVALRLPLDPPFSNLRIKAYRNGNQVEIYTGWYPDKQENKDNAVAICGMAQADLSSFTNLSITVYAANSSALAYTDSYGRCVDA